MKISDLRQYRKNAELLECIESQLERQAVADTVQGDSGAPAHERITKPVEGYIHGMGTVSLLTEKSRLRAAQREIERYISAIPNSRVRKALELYCLDLSGRAPTWETVAARLGEESPKALEMSVRREIEKT